MHVLNFVCFRKAVFICQFFFKLTVKTHPSKSGEDLSIFPFLAHGTSIKIKIKMSHALLCTGNHSYSYEVCFAVVILVWSCNCFLSLEGKVGQKQK